MELCLRWFTNSFFYRVFGSCLPYFPAFIGRLRLMPAYKSPRANSPRMISVKKPKIVWRACCLLNLSCLNLRKETQRQGYLYSYYAKKHHKIFGQLHPNSVYSFYNGDYLRIAEPERGDRLGHPHYQPYFFLCSLFSRRTIPRKICTSPFTMATT